MPAKVTGDSLLIHDIYILIIDWSLGLCSVTSGMTGYSRSYYSIKLIHCSAPQRDVLNDKMVFCICFEWRLIVLTSCFANSFLSSTVISFLYKDKWW